MSGDLSVNNPTPWPAPPAAGEQRLRSTTTSPMQSPTLNAGTLQAALQQQQPPLSSSPPAAAPSSAAASFSASSQQTLLRGSSSLSVAAAAGANNNSNGHSSAEATSPDSSGEERRFFGGVVGLSPGRAHHLRVRKRVRLAPNVEAELGVGRELLSGEVTRHAALTYDLNLAGRHLVSLRATPGLLQAARSFTLSLPRSCASAVVRLVAGVTRDGRPVFGFDVDEVGPPKLVAAAAAAALASGRPLAGAKSVPLFTARVPSLYDSWCGRVEVRASVQKKEEARRGAAAAAAAGRSASSSLDLLDGGAAAAAAAAKAERNDDIFGPLALDVRELSFVLDV